MALVAGFPLQLRRLESHIADLEHLHRQAVVFILADRLEEARQQARAHDLVFCCLGVREADCRLPIIFAVQPGEVLVVRAQYQGEDFGPPGHGGFEADDVGEFVDGQRLGDGGADIGEGAGEFVEAVGDADVFHDVGLVQDVGAGRGDEDVEDVGGGAAGFGGVGHAGEEVADLGGLERDPRAAVDVVDLGLGGAWGEVGDDAGLVVVRGVDLDGLDGEGLGGVLAEHGDEDLADDFDFGAVGGGDFDEDVFGAGGDFRVLAVDDGWEGADGAVRVVDDRVDGAVADDV